MQCCQTTYHWSDTLTSETSKNIKYDTSVYVYMLLCVIFKSDCLRLSDSVLKKNITGIILYFEILCYHLLRIYILIKCH